MAASLGPFQLSTFTSPRASPYPINAFAKYCWDPHSQWTFPMVEYDADTVRMVEMDRIHLKILYTSGPASYSADRCKPLVLHARMRTACYALASVLDQGSFGMATACSSWVDLLRGGIGTDTGQWAGAVCRMRYTAVRAGNIDGVDVMLVPVPPFASIRCRVGYRRPG